MTILQTKTYIVVFATKHGCTSYNFPATDFFDCTEKVKKFLQADGEYMDYITWKNITNK